MRIRDFYTGLDDAAKAAYASRVGTTTQTIERKYLNADHVPRRDRMADLIAATDGKVSRVEMLDHFYPEQEAA